MSSDPREARARRWLSEQMELLKALRTSNVRDTEFKQWRQSTLTIIQRIWPGEGKRSARFRRIPFSPPSSQAPLREVREFYERGCAEAAQLLKALLDEVEQDGLPAASEPARPASIDPGVAEDDFPTLDLPGGPAKPAKAAARDEEDAADDGGARPGAVSVRGGRNGEAGARRPGPERRRKQAKNTPRRRLRDMLGLDALEKLAKNGEPEPADPAPAQEEKPAAPAPAHTEPHAGAGADSADPPMPEDDRIEAPDDSAEFEEASQPASGEPAQAADEEDAAAEPAGAEDEDETEEPAPFTADEFLSASPIFHTEGKPVRRARREPPPEPIEGEFGPAPLTSSTAIAVAAIAAEVARLGVPDGQRARTRATLVNLAQLVEDGALDWEALRAAVAFAMDCPPIGRRLLPLLIPFLDQAA